MAEKRQFAIIDANGVLLSYVFSVKDRSAANHVEVPPGCDLVPGRYRWNGTDKRWDPVGVGIGNPDVIDEPEALYCIAEGFLAVAGQGISLPETTLAWATRRVADERAAVEKAAKGKGKGK